MSYVNEIRCDVCGKTTKDEHFRIDERVDIEHRRWHNLFQRYDTIEYHVCKSCWYKMRSQIRNERLQEECE